jgi:hypothetical protein
MTNEQKQQLEDAMSVCTRATDKKLLILFRFDFSDEGLGVALTNATDPLQIKWLDRTINGEEI